MIDSAIGQVSPEASLGTASDVSHSQPSSKDEGVSSDNFKHYHISIGDNQKWCAFCDKSTKYFMVPLHTIRSNF